MWRRVRAWLRRDVIAEEIREEYEFHMAMRRAEYERRGVVPADAARQVQRRFGNVMRLRDEGYDVRGAGLIDQLLQDARYSLRLWRRHPARHLATGATLALGLALLATLAAIVDAAWIRPLPVVRADRLVSVQLRSQQPGGETDVLAPSVQDVLALRDATDVLAAVGGHFSFDERLVVDRGDPERATVQRATPGFFEAHGARPFAGRFFTDDDTRSSGTSAVIVGHAYWSQRLGADPAIVGSSMVLEGETVTVVGVLPPGLFRHTHIWTPLSSVGERAERRGTGLDVVARLADGVPLAAAAEALAARVQSWTTSPVFGRVNAVELASVYDEVFEQSRMAMAFIVVTVGVLVLVIIVNVAGLVGAQGTARRQELAVRASMGAGRGRLVQQQLVEATCLGVAAAFVGAIAAWMALETVVALLPLDLPPHTAVSVNWRVFAATGVLGVVTAWVSVALPAWRQSSFDLRAWLSGPGVAVRRRWAGRPGQTAVFLQVSLAAALLAGGGLLVQTVNRLLDVDLGFKPAGLYALEVVPTSADPLTWRTFYPALVERMRQIPGMAAVGATDWVPLSDQMIAFMATKPGEDLDISLVGVTPGFDLALGLSVQEGRWFGGDDEEQPVAVLSVSAARALGVDSAQVVGKVVDVGERLTVIGVVDDIRGWGPKSKPQSVVYTPLHPHNFMPPSIVFRTDGPVPSLPEVRAMVTAMGTRAVVERIRPGEALLGDNIERPRQRRGVLVLVSVLGLSLALMGVAGIAMSSVSARTREIGVRMAFGASASQVVRLVAMDAVWPSVAGVAAGLAAAAYGSRLLETFLFNTSTRDPFVFATVGASVMVVASMVAWIPARMAARVNPVDSLRAE